MRDISRSTLRGRLPEASCWRGTGAAPASDGGRNLVPGPYSGSLVGHYDPARSDHGQRHKGQDAALARRKARGVTLHAQGPAIRARPGVTRSRAGLAKSRPCALWRADPRGCGGDGRRGKRAPPGPRPSRVALASRAPGPVWRNPGHAPCGAPTPSVARETEEEEEGRPPGPEPQTGGDILLTQRNAQSCRVGKGAGTTSNTKTRLSCAVPTRHGSMHNTHKRVGTAHERLRHVETKCQRLCPPYESLASAGTNGGTALAKRNHARLRGVSIPPTQRASIPHFVTTKPPQRKHPRTQRHNADFSKRPRFPACTQNRFPPRIEML